ncbi:MAG: FtsQ-type POTRA domain-containing protein [Nitrospirae bacterium]|nr:FtsQ-type POTRA domain-containing protein [Nitrospirota bacterium]
MQLKRLKNKNGKSAYRRGEKLLMYFKRGGIALSLIAVIAVIVFAIRLSTGVFPVRNIIVTGNENIEENDIRDAMTSETAKGLLRVSLKDIDRTLRTQPWVKEVFLRKEYPDTLRVSIEETTAKAILNFNGSLYLMDGRGNILETIKEEKTPFLPVITGIDYRNSKADVVEALRLIDALSEEGFLAEKDSIEITLKPYGLSMNMDGEIFKVGYGNYDDKLKRWKDLEEEIIRRGIAVEYIDLRFAGRVIVQPVKQESSLPSKRGKKK